MAAYKKIGIVIPVLNQFQLAVEMMASIDTYHNIKLYPILNYEENLSLAGAWNLGCKKALEDRCDYILITNDDILLSPITIGSMVFFMETRDRTPDHQNVVMVTGRNMRGAMQPKEILNYEKLSTDHGENPDFSCFMINKETLDLIGSFDENFNPAYFEDNDYHRRILLAGFKALNLGTAPFYHYGSRTQNATDVPVVPSFIFEVNRLYYIGKWGGDVGIENYTIPFNDPEKTLRDW